MSTPPALLTFTAQAQFTRSATDAPVTVARHVSLTQVDLNEVRQIKKGPG